jgi:integrase
MGKKPVNHYTLRKDGRRVKKKTYKGDNPAGYSGLKYFYGKDDDDINQQISDFEDSLSEPAKVRRSRLLSEVAGDWWDQKEPKLSPNSVGSYQAKKNEIVAEFGDIPIDELTTQQIFQWLQKKASQGYAQRGITDRKSVMNKIIEFAVANGEISVNPCSVVPEVKGAKAKKRHPASDGDIEKIEAHKTDSLIARLYYFMEYTGCRIGECAVLQEKDIDRERHLAIISKDLAFDGQVPVVKPSAKTEAGEREVDLYDNVLEILPKYKDPDTFIFFPDGLPRKSPYETALRKYRRDTGVTATAHQMRHTYASIMHSAEMDVKDTQARMGHSSVAITQDIYTEIERSHNEKARNKANRYVMEERLGRGKKKCPRCGSIYLVFEDGHVCNFCPDCGQKLG